MLTKPIDQASVVLPPHIRKELDDIITGRVRFPNAGKSGILLAGPSGIGKTTLARLLPRAMNPYRNGIEQVVPTFLPLRSDNNGATFVRTLSHRLELIPVDGDFHYVIIDEAGNLTKPSMQSLRSLMDIPCTIFILTTNDVSQIDATIIRRCRVFEVDPPPATCWLAIAKQALIDKGITKPPSDQKLLEIIERCFGSVSDIDTQLQRLALRLKEAQQASMSQNNPEGVEYGSIKPLPLGQRPAEWPKSL